MDTYDIFQAAVALRCAHLQSVAMLGAGGKNESASALIPNCAWPSVVAEAIAGIQEAYRQWPGPQSRMPGADRAITPTAAQAAGAV